MKLLFEKYQNVLLCFGPKYRNWIMLDKEFTEQDFEKQMNLNKYVSHLMFNSADEIFVYIILFHHLSHHLSKTDTFRKFLHTLINKTHKSDIDNKKKFLEKQFDDKGKIEKILKYEAKNLEAIFITKKELTTYFLRNIQTQKNKIHLTVHNYLHKRFLLEITNGPLCSKHTILTKQEAKTLCNEHLMTSKFKLPYILITDPQIIWCGAKIGDIVRIEVNSDLSGKAIRYRLVVPQNGKIQGIELSDTDEDNDELDDGGEDATEEEFEAEVEVDEIKEEMPIEDDDE